ERIRDRDEDVPVLERDRRPDGQRRADRLDERRLHVTPAEERVEGEPERKPAEAGVAGRRVLDDDDEPRDSRPEAAEDREERPVDAAPAEVRARAEDDLLVALLVAERDHRAVRDGERE